MQNEAYIVAVYGPLIVTALFVCGLYGRWAWIMLVTDHADRPKLFHLIAGVTLAFAAAAVENGYWVVHRLTQAGILGVGSETWRLDHFVPVVVFVKVALWGAGTLHLHAYWVAQHGRSWWGWWLAVSGFWYVVLAGMLSGGVWPRFTL